MNDINAKSKSNESRKSMKSTRKKIIKATKLTESQLLVERSKFEKAIMRDEFCHDPYLEKSKKNI